MKVQPTIYVSRKSLDDLLMSEGNHVALQTLIHRKPLRSGNGVPLYASPCLVDLESAAVRAFEMAQSIKRGRGEIRVGYSWETLSETTKSCWRSIAEAVAVSFVDNGNIRELREILREACPTARREGRRFDKHLTFR